MPAIKRKKIVQLNNMSKKVCNKNHKELFHNKGFSKAVKGNESQPTKTFTFDNNLLTGPAWIFMKNSPKKKKKAQTKS